MNSNIIIQQALELGFQFDQFEKNDTMQDVGEAILEFFKENSDKLPQVEDHCEVHGHGNRQYVSYRNYSCSGQIVDYSEDWNKPAGTKVFHSDFVFLDSDGLHKQMNLYYLVEDIRTFDVIFNSDTDSNEKGMAVTIDEARKYISQYNGTNESYFADYKGGTVSVVCNMTGEVVYTENVL